MEDLIPNLSVAVIVRLPIEGKEMTPGSCSTATVQARVRGRLFRTVLQPSWLKRICAWELG